MLFFASISLLVTAIQEGISSFLKLRGSNLKKGINQLVGDKMAKSVCSHPLMETMKAKKSQWGIGEPFPSYLKSKYFSQILVDVISPKDEVLGDGMKKVGKSIDKISNENLKKILKIFHQKANGEMEKFEGLLSEWFDAGMERASGWYQRKVQLILLVISFVVVVVINANALNVAKTLWKDKSARNRIVAMAEAMSQSDLAENEKREIIMNNMNNNIRIPLGWEHVGNHKDCWYERINSALTWTSFLGWIITILAVSLGAPFWFDLIGKISKIRKSSKEKTSQGDNKA